MPLTRFEVTLPSKQCTSDLQKLGFSLYTAMELNIINVVLLGKKNTKKSHLIKIYLYKANQFAQKDLVTNSL